MGRGDNRRTPKSLRRKAMRRSKSRILKRIEEGKALTPEQKKARRKATRTKSSGSSTVTRRA